MIQLFREITTVSNAAPSPGQELADRLSDGVRVAVNAPLPGARELTVLRGMTKAGTYTNHLENVLAEAGRLLADGGRVFTRGDQVVLEIDRSDATGKRLVPLRTADRVEAGAEANLANVLIFEQTSKDETFQFPPPRSFVEVLLRSEPFMKVLPAIRVYSRTPIFDEEFVLRGPGYHPDGGILIHGPSFDPVYPLPAESTVNPVDRFPHLRSLLTGFCFAEGTDLANTIGVLITGLLINHFIIPSKPIVLFDGNRPGVGKSVLARAIGLVLSGEDPPLIHYSNDEEELAKRLCANLRGGQTGLIFIDNAKCSKGGAVDSPVLEANSVAPQITLRILGLSQNYSRPNDVIWCLTMNGTKTSPDITSRGLPIRLSFDGDPADRVFSGPDPLSYAREHRFAILAEVAGMVVNWTELGRPGGTRGHRCGHWARVVGGVLTAAGFGDFLANLGTAAAAFTTGTEDLAALAETIASSNRYSQAIILAPNPGSTEDVVPEEPRGLTANDWVSIFAAAQVLNEELVGCKTPRAKATRIGLFLNPFVGREVEIEIRGRSGRAALRVEAGRSRAKRFYFEVTLHADSPNLSTDEGDGLGNPPNGCPTPVPAQYGRQTALAPPSIPPPAEEYHTPLPTVTGNDEVWD